MRQIKFKALDMQDEWHYGMPTALKREYDGIPAGMYFPNKGGAVFAYEVRPKTLCQFTGLKDRNGVDIYEDDIITGKCSDSQFYVCEGIRQSNLMGKKLTGIVRYSDIFAKFYFTTDDITFLDFQNGIRDFEVIGNIHDHRSLLEK